MAEDALEPLVTQCPTCRTRFRVTEVQLGIAGGRVRCGACLSVFTGVENLVSGTQSRLRPGESADSALDALLNELRNDEPLPRAPVQHPTKPVKEDKAEKAAVTSATVASPESTPESLPEPEVESEVAPSDTLDVDDDDEIEIEITAAAVDAEADETGIADDEAAEEIDLTPAPEPSEPQPELEPEPVATVSPPLKPAASRDGIAAKKPVKPRAMSVNAPSVVTPIRPSRAAFDIAVDPDALVVVPPPRRRWWVWPLMLACGVGLVGEALYLRFDEWAKNPQIRPVYAWVCPYLGCRLPEMRAVDKMVSKNLVVRASPDVAGALLVDAIIVNEAAFAQPFPVIELRFSALDGSPVTTQSYTPDKYLAGELKGIKLIAPMTPVHIALDINDPGPKAVNYVMGFR